MANLHQKLHLAAQHVYCPCKLPKYVQTKCYLFFGSQECKGTIQGLFLSARTVSCPSGTPCIHAAVLDNNSTEALPLLWKSFAENIPIFWNCKRMDFYNFPFKWLSRIVFDETL